MATKKKVTNSKISNSKIKKAVTEKALISVIDLEKLRKLNVWLGAIFFLQAIAVVLFGGSKSASITTHYLSIDQLGSQAAGHQVLGAATRHLFDIRLTVVAAIFLLVFSLISFALATVCRNHYETQLQRNSNSARWLSFALAGGFVLTALAIEGGFYDLGSLVAIFALTVVGIGLQPVAEKLKANGVTNLFIRGISITGLCLAVVPWFLFILSIVGVLLWGGHMPGSVYVMYATTFLLLSCWLLAIRFRNSERGRWTDVVYAEKMYMFLGIAIGTVLAWQIFAGAL